MTHQRPVAATTSVIDAPSDGAAGAAVFVARRTVELLARNGKLDAGRILLLQPRSRELGPALRALGFRGERWTLVAHEAVDHEAFDHLDLDMDATGAHHIVHDWLSAIAGENGASAESNQMTAQPDHGQLDAAFNAAFNAASDTTFDAIVACDLSTLVKRTHVPALLAWFERLLALRGFLVLDEPSAPANVRRLAEWEPALAEGGFLQITDMSLIPNASLRGGSASRVSVALQYRGADECRQSGMLRRVTVEDLDSDRQLLGGIVATYREVFGGDEWQEWMRCSNPACGRHYSQRDVAQLEPPERCLCGWAAPLEPFHHPEQVAAQLRRELAQRDASRCYVRAEPNGGIDALIWGYLTTPEQLAEVLLADDQPIARRQFLERLAALCAGLGIASADARIYYQSQIGALGQVRGLGLVRNLFQRVLQFAADQGARLVVTRTSPRTGAYPLLVGLDFQVIYRYDEPADVEVALGDELESVQSRAVDHRVVFGGDVEQILHTICATSDRRIALQIAHRLRERPMDALSAHHLHAPNAHTPHVTHGDAAGSRDRASAG